MKKEMFGLYKITDNGDVQWKITKSQYNAGKVLDIQKTIDNHYIALTYDTNENGVANWRLVKFNNEGRITWEKNLSSDIFAKSGYHMGNLIQDKLGNYIIATTEEYKNKSDIRVTKISEEGTILFSKLYGLGIGEKKKYCERVSVIIEANNGGIYSGVYTIDTVLCVVGMIYVYLELMKTGIFYGMMFLLLIVNNFLSLYHYKQ